MKFQKCGGHFVFAIYFVMVSLSDCLSATAERWKLTWDSKEPFVTWHSLLSVLMLSVELITIIS